MFHRTKIGVVLMLAGTLTGVSASLNRTRKTAARPDEVSVVPFAIKPSGTKAGVGTSSLWRGVKVKKIQAVKPPGANRSLGGFLITKNDGFANAGESIFTVKTGAKKP